MHVCMYICMYTHISRCSSTHGRPQTIHQIRSFRLRDGSWRRVARRSDVSASVPDLLQVDVCTFFQCLQHFHLATRGMFRYVLKQGRWPSATPLSASCPPLKPWAGTSKLRGPGFYAKADLISVQGQGGPDSRTQLLGFPGEFRSIAAFQDSTFCTRRGAVKVCGG